MSDFIMADKCHKCGEVFTEVVPVTKPNDLDMQSMTDEGWTAAGQCDKCNKQTKMTETLTPVGCLRVYDHELLNR